MKRSEWLIVGAKVSELWPNQSWPLATMASAYELFKDIAQEPALKAVAELCAEGREFAPAPGVVLARTLQIAIASTPQLQDPDLTRPLTDEELDRARRMAAALAGDKARLTQATWRVFADHAKACDGRGEEIKRCDLVADRCRHSGLQSNVFPPMLNDLCSSGRLLFEAWRYAVDDLRSQLSPSGAVQQEAAL